MAIVLISQIDSNGYGSEGNPGPEFELKAGLEALIDTWKGMKTGWWNEAGYETYWDCVQQTELSAARMGLSSIYKRRRSKVSELPDASPPDVDLEALAADATRPSASRDRQVNVRLTQLGFNALTQAAERYGLRPTTLARLLIHRGALAVLEEARIAERSDAD